MSAGGINTLPSLGGMQPATVVQPQGQVQSQSLVPAAATQATWSDEWAQRLADAGLDAATIQQLNFTGAMGAGDAQLQQMLTQVQSEADQQLATFEHDHPEEFRELAAVKGLTQWVDNSGDSDRAALVKIATAVNSGQVPADQLTQLADSAGKSQGKMIFDSFIKPMVVWSLIPGWGALRLLPAPFTGGRDILTGEKLFGDPMTTGFTLLAAAGGGLTLYNNVRGAMQVAQGHRMIAAGGDASLVAAHEGVQHLSLGQKIWSYVPGTKLNQQIAGISRLDDIRAGIGDLKGVQRELAQNLYNKVVAGDVQLLGDSASKITKMGYQPNSRGFIMGHLFGKKAAASVISDGAVPSILLDGRTTGKVTASQFASLGVGFADDAAKVSADGIVQPMLRSRVAGALDLANASTLKNVQALHLGEASQQLLDAGAITRPTGISKLLGALRPGAIQDSVWAADNVASGTIGKLHGWAGIPKLGRMGLFGAAAAAGVYFLGIKPQLDAAKAAQEQQGGAAPAPETMPAPVPEPVPAGDMGGYTLQGLGLG